MKTPLISRLSFGIPLLLGGAVAVMMLRSTIVPSHAASLSQRAVVHKQAQRAQYGKLNVTGPLIAYPPGVPAIQPTLNVNTASGVSGAAYVADDVQRFVVSHKFFPTTDGTTPEVAKILFIPASQASALLHGESIGRPATALVCYVEIHGNLDRSGVMHSPIANNPMLTTPAHVGQLVFDAVTGNILIRGFYD